MLGSSGMSLKFSLKTQNHMYSLPSLTLSISPALATLAEHWFWKLSFLTSFEGFFSSYRFNFALVTSNMYKCRSLWPQVAILFSTRRKIQALCWLTDLWNTKASFILISRSSLCDLLDKFEQLADKHQEVLMNNND